MNGVLLEQKISDFKTKITTIEPKKQFVYSSSSVRLWCPGLIKLSQLIDKEMEDVNSLSSTTASWPSSKL